MNKKKKNKQTIKNNQKFILLSRGRQKNVLAILKKGNKVVLKKLLVKVNLKQETKKKMKKSLFTFSANQSFSLPLLSTLFVNGVISSLFKCFFIIFDYLLGLFFSYLFTLKHDNTIPSYLLIKLNTSGNLNLFFISLLHVSDLMFICIPGSVMGFLSME